MLSGFYCHQRKLQVISLDKIKAWVDKEEKNKGKFISIGSNNGNKNNLSP